MPGARLGIKSLDGLFASTTGWLVLVLLVVLALSLYLGLTDRITVRIGFRNFVRGRKRTVVLLLGLLVGTAIISSSLVVGDTVTTLSTHFAYVMDGNVHEAVYVPSSAGYAPLPYAFYERLNSSASGLPYVKGLTPLMVVPGAVSGLDQKSGVPQTGMNLIGTDANVSAALGPFTSTGGGAISGPAPGEVLLNPTSAQELDAGVGDRLLLNAASGQNLSVTVLSIVQADGRGGFQDNGGGNILTTISDAQFLMGTPGQINYIGVTNVGGATGGIAHTSQVWSELNSTLPGVVASFPVGSLPKDIKAYSLLGSDVSRAASSASQLTTIFLVIGLFSIVSGAILVVGIFVLLSEERRGQMGVARAIGMTRRQLVKTYYFEGLAYSAGSALLGTLVGVGVAFVLLEVLETILVPGTSSQAVLSSFTVLPSSLLTAYTAGFLLTLGTVVVTVRYVAQMNIVRAIRNLPEPPLTRRSYVRIGKLGAGIVTLGLLLIYAGLPSSVDIDVALLGTSIVLLGAGLVAVSFVPNRYAMTATGLALIVFWGDYPLRQTIFGNGHPGFIFVYFQEGIFLILGSVLLYLFNADLVMRGISRLVARSPRKVPVAMVAFSYPAHKRFRTAMTISIFAMVLFTIVAVASIGSGFSSSLGDMVQSESGGYTMAGFSENPISDMPAVIFANSTLSSEVSTVIPFYSALAHVTPSGGSHGGFFARIASTPTGLPSREDFYTTNQYNFSDTQDGMNPTQVWQTLETDPTAAVVSGDYGASGFQFGPSGPHMVVGEGLNLTTQTSNSTLHVHIVGTLSESILSVILLNPSAMTRTLGANQTSLFLIGTSPRGSAQQTIYDLKREFYPYGLQLLDFQQVFDNGLQFTIAFIDILEIFVGIGLIVGIAAIGILALRAVVERRSEIGMIRALGFRKSQVLAAFLTEYSFLSLLGIAMGVFFGILLSYNISEGVSGFFSFSIPWTNIAVVVGLSYGLTLLATGGPSYAGSRIPPSEALRYSE